MAIRPIVLFAFTALEGRAINRLYVNLKCFPSKDTDFN